jgi:hypothetical protein
MVFPSRCLQTSLPGGGREWTSGLSVVGVPQLCQHAMVWAGRGSPEAATATAALQWQPTPVDHRPNKDGQFTRLSARPSAMVKS